MLPLRHAGFLCALFPFGFFQTDRAMTSSATCPQVTSASVERVISIVWSRQQIYKGAIVVSINAVIAGEAIVVVTVDALLFASVMRVVIAVWEETKAQKLVAMMGAATQIPCQ